MGDKFFLGTGRSSKLPDELQALKKELAEVKEKHDILKKAAVYFAIAAPIGLRSPEAIAVNKDLSSRRPDF